MGRTVKNNCHFPHTNIKCCGRKTHSVFLAVSPFTVESPSTAIPDQQQRREYAEWPAKMKENSVTFQLQNYFFSLEMLGRCILDR